MQQDNQQTVELLLICACPPDCTCGDRKPAQWVHSVCKTKQYINNKGDIYCQLYKDSKKAKCHEYFIQNAQFSCIDPNLKKTTNQYKSAADFCVALSQALKAAEISLEAMAQINFIMTLQVSVMTRWIR